MYRYEVYIIYIISKFMTYYFVVKLIIKLILQISNNSKTSKLIFVLKSVLENIAIEQKTFHRNLYI